MKNIAKYDYICEYYTDDGYEEIMDSDFSTKLKDVWPPKHSDAFPDCNARLGVLRMWGNEVQGELERGYAYEGETHFDSGQKVPKHIYKAINQ